MYPLLLLSGNLSGQGDRDSYAGIWRVVAGIGLDHNTVGRREADFQEGVPNDAG